MNTSANSWCTAECVDCGATIESSAIAHCESCMASHAQLYPIASTSALTPPPCAPRTSSASSVLPRTKSQCIRDWAHDVFPGAPSRTTSFAGALSNLPALSTEHLAPTPRATRIARSPSTPQRYSRPALLQTQRSVPSLRLSRESSKPADNSTSPLPTPVPRPQEQPICAAGSSVASSMLGALRTWMPTSPSHELPDPVCRLSSASTLVDLDVIDEKALFVSAQEEEDVHEEEEHDEEELVEENMSSTSSRSAAELSSHELGRLVSSTASRHRTSRAKLPVVPSGQLMYSCRS